MRAKDTLPPSVAALYPFTPHALDVGAHQLSYVDEGRGEPILFVHGNPTWSFYWRHLVAGLSDQFRCIAPDHLGCGLSDKPQDFSYRLRDHIRNLRDLVDRLDLRNLTLVVHDWGGPIGLGMAIERPERVARLVILNTGVFEGPIPLSIRACRWPGVGAPVIRGLNGFVKVGLMRATADRSRFAGAVGEGYLAPYDSWANRVAILRFIQDIPFEQGHPTRDLFFSIGDNLGVLRGRPVMIGWGEQDFCFTTFYRDGFVERFPDAEVHSWPDVGHWIAEDAHERLVPLIRDFITNHPLAAG